MTKFIFLLIVVAIFSSCENNNLDGHWHFYNIQNVNLENGAFPYELIIEIKGDSALLNNKQIMFHDRKKNSLETLDSHRGITKFGYTWSNDTFFITTKNIEYYAVRCISICCDRQIDTFIDIGVDVNLPVLIKSSLAQAQGKKLSLATNVYIGKPKESIYSDVDIRLYNNGHYFYVDDLEKIATKRKIKVPEKYRDKMYYQIYADKNVKFEYVREVVAELERIGIDNIYLVVRMDTNLQEAFIPKNVKVTLNNFSNLDQIQTIAEYVETLR